MIPGDQNQDQALDFEEWQSHDQAADDKARQLAQMAQGHTSHDQNASSQTSKPATTAANAGKDLSGQVSRGISEWQSEMQSSATKDQANGGGLGRPVRKAVDEPGPGLRGAERLGLLSLRLLTTSRLPAAAGGRSR